MSSRQELTFHRYCSKDLKKKKPIGAKAKTMMKRETAREKENLSSLPIKVELYLSKFTMISIL